MIFNEHFLKMRKQFFMNNSLSTLDVNSLECKV